VRQRAELYGHVHTARRQANLPPVSNERVSGPARTCSPAQRPRSAEWGRPSPHVCWVRLVGGLGAPEPRLLPIASRVAAEPPSPLLQSTRNRGKKRLTVPGKEKYCLLTRRALCGFGANLSAVRG
jgi:hypothetical protein